MRPMRGATGLVKLQPTQQQTELEGIERIQVVGDKISEQYCIALLLVYYQIHIHYRQALNDPTLLINQKVWG